MKAMMRRQNLKKIKFDLKELQKIAVDRQKRLNRYTKHKKAYLRLREKSIFKKIMATRLDDDSENDLEFNDNSSIESEFNDFRFKEYINNVRYNQRHGDSKSEMNS